MKILRLLLTVLPLVAALSVEQVQAQSITPAPDGTGTLVKPDGNRIDIGGGQTSSDGANLFHSFEKFGLNQNEIANFLSNPSIQNILGRVVGGDASLINGLIQVSGGNSNLFLMNPAGIIFGNSASLNLPANFVATTADGIRFGANWFNAAGENNYATLIGTPDAFAFTMGQPGTIVNAGNLKVTQGHNLSLLGGTVVSTGQLSGAGGQITVAAVPGKNMVRLSQSGNLLSLDIPITPSSSQPNQWNFPISSLAELLTGNGTGNNLGLQINSNGQAELAQSGISLQTGDVAARNVTAQTATLLANRNLTLVESQLSTTEDLNLLAKDTVRVRDSVANPFIAQAGGQLYVQGNQAVDIFALNHPASGFFSGGDMVQISSNTLRGDAHYTAGGNFQVEQLDGSLGSLFSPYDAVVRAGGDVSFSSYSGASLHILAGGAVNIPGNVTLSDKTPSINGTAGQILDIRSGADITIGSITNNGGAVFLTNQYSNNRSLPDGAIQVGSINTNVVSGNAGSVTIDSRNNIILTDRLDAGTNFGNGGAITLKAQNDITTAGVFSDSSSQGTGGTISFTGNTTILSGDVSTTNQDIIFNGPVTGNVVLGTDVTFDTGTGTVLFSNPVNGTNQGTQSLTVNGNASFDRADVGNNVAPKFLSVTGTANIVGASVTTTGNQTYGALTVGDLNTTLTGNNITVNSTIRSSNSLQSQSELTVNTTDNGVTTFGGAVGDNNQPLRSLTTNPDGQTVINGDSVTTTANQTYTDAVTLGRDTTLNGTNITFGSTVNSDAIAPRNLTVSTSGNGVTTFNGVVGGTAPLASLTTNADGQTQIGANITTSGNAITTTFNDSVILTTDTVLRDTGTTGIHFNNTVDSDEGARSLSVNATSGSISFGSTVGGSTPLANLTTNSQLLTQTGDVRVDNSVLFTADNMNIQGNTTSGVVTLQPQTTGQQINLGGGDSDRTLGLTSDELNRVSAETLRVGSSNSGDLSVTAAIAPTRTSTLSLISGGKITQTAGITATNLGLTSNGPITLNDSGNDVSVLAAQTNNAGFSYIDSNNLALGTVDGITGITTTGSVISQGSNIDLTATAIDTIGTTGGPLNASATNGNAGNITLTSTQGDIEVSSINAQSTAGKGGNVTINSNQFFRVLATLPQRPDTSISAVGRTDGGSIVIRQAGGLLRKPFQPFIVGDPTVNGTAGNIVTSQGGQGNEVILRTDVPGSIIRGSQDVSGFLRITTDDPPATFIDPQPVLRQPGGNDISLATTTSSVTKLEEAQCQQFEKYFGDELPEFGGEKNKCDKLQTAEDIENLLRGIVAQTGKKAAIVYISPEAQELKLTAYFPTGALVTKSLPQANRTALLRVAREFRTEAAPFFTDPVTSEVNLDVNKLKTTSYLASAQQLYQWLIAPLEADLKARGIDTLVLSVGSGLRSLPLAALHDGQRFLVEKYSIGLLPSLNLTDTRYRSLQNSRILAMGASTFTDLPPLPAVPVEITAIVQNPWQGQSFLNENFTVNKLKAERQGQPFNIVHLATHAEFQPGQPSESFIQLGNVRLGLNQLRQLRLDTPTVELLVLSACQTALGDESAELGFAGLALAAGVKTAVGSLWTVSDVGTLSLMTEFYRQLGKAPIKAEALRQAQIAMLKGQLRLEGNQLIGATGQLPLPPDTAKLLNEQIASYQGIKDLGHPYFWSAFTMIGSPW